MVGEWKDEMPSEPGDYLFCGKFGRPGDQGSQVRNRFEVCHVGRASNGVLVHTAGGIFLYEGEFTGRFAKLDVRDPSLQGEGGGQDAAEEDDPPGLAGLRV